MLDRRVGEATHKRPHITGFHLRGTGTNPVGTEIRTVAGCGVEMGKGREELPAVLEMPYTLRRVKVIHEWTPLSKLIKLYAQDLCISQKVSDSPM